VYDEQYNQVAQSEWLSGTRQWTMTAALRRGARYSWRLSVRQTRGLTLVLPSGSAEVRFRVLSGADDWELRYVRGAYPNSHLLLGVTYTRLGLLAEAEEQLRHAKQDNPRSESVGALLENVQHMRPLNQPHP
jgi:hypothetical protein